MMHPVTWFEVLGHDGDRLRTFFADLFGWTFDADNPIKYGTADTKAGRGILGGIGTTYPGTRSWVTFYVETPSVTASLQRATDLGAKVVLPRTVMAGATFGIFEDPEGHAIGLVEARADAH